VHFWPDPKFFDTDKFLVSELRHTLKAKAVLCPGLKVRFQNEATGEKDEWLAEDAATGLGAIKCAKAVPKLVAMVGDGNAGPYRRAAAARALGRIGDPKAVAPLVAAVDRAKQPEERFALTWALGQFDHPDAKAALESLQKDSDVLVAKAAKKALQDREAK